MQKIIHALLTCDLQIQMGKFSVNAKGIVAVLAALAILMAFMEMKFF